MTDRQLSKTKAITLLRQGAVLVCVEGEYFMTPNGGFLNAEVAEEIKRRPGILAVGTWRLMRG